MSLVRRPTAGLVRARLLYLLIGAIAAAILILLFWEKPRGQLASAPQNPEFSGSSLPSADTTLEVKLLELEKALGSVRMTLLALQERISALEGMGSTDPAIEVTGILSSEEFARVYEPHIRALLQRVSKEEARFAEAKKVNEDVQRYIVLYNLDAKQAQELYLLLLRIKREVLDMRERFVPNAVVLHKNSADYELLETAWHDILDRWAPMIAQFTGAAYARTVLNDLLPNDLRGKLQ